MSTGDQVARIRKYIGQLKDDGKVSHALSRLDKIDMTVALLTETGVGKEVNRLRNHSELGQKAQKIVEKWRKLASEQSEVLNNASSMNGKTTNNDRKRPIDEDVEELKSTQQISFADALKAPAPVPKKIRCIIKEPEEVIAAATPKEQFIPKNFVPVQSQKVQNEEDPAQFGARRGKPMKIYAGRKQVKTVTKVDSLFNLAMTVCMQNIDSFTHGPLPTVYSVFQPVLARCTIEQLERVEEYNPQIEEDTDPLWKTICLKAFPKPKSPKEYDENWKAYYKRLIEERELKLQQISNRIKKENKTDQMVTKMSDAITPLNVRRRQANNGTVVQAYQVPHAIEVTKARREIFNHGSKAGVAALPAAMRLGGIGPASSSSSRSTSSSTMAPQKKGALMAKTLKMMKSRQRR